MNTTCTSTLHTRNIPLFFFPAALAGGGVFLTGVDRVEAGLREGIEGAGRGEPCATETDEVEVVPAFGEVDRETALFAGGAFSLAVVVPAFTTGGFFAMAAEGRSVPGARRGGICFWLIVFYSSSLTVT
jgi:hypothetical protein